MLFERLVKWILPERKKVILFIVEGITEEESLALILSKLSSDRDIRFEIVSGDITSDRHSTTQNILKKLYEPIKKVKDTYKFRESDFEQIIHLVDTDGAYIPDSNILGSPIPPKFTTYYAADCILSVHPGAIKQRNDQKRQLLNLLINTSQIHAIPYRVFYLSCNLEHVLHGDANVLSQDKMKLATQFSDHYANDLAGFSSWITDLARSVQGDYQETWAYIKVGLNSLKKGTNLHLALEFALREWKHKVD